MESIEWPSEWARAALPAAVLALVSDEDAYGYLIAQRLAAAGFGTVKGSTLYPLLARLEQDGSLADPESALRTRATAALVDIGQRLTTDAQLQQRVNTWVIDAAVFLVDRYRHEISSIISDTVASWDADETS